MKYVLIKDLETKEFNLWTEGQYKIYCNKVEEVGACPGISEIAVFDEAVERLIDQEVLKKAVDVIKAWHQADNVWNIYYNHAPEMKPIREALQNNNT